MPSIVDAHSDCSTTSLPFTPKIFQLINFPTPLFQTMPLKEIEDNSQSLSIEPIVARSPD